MSVEAKQLIKIYGIDSATLTLLAQDDELSAFNFELNTVESETNDIAVIGSNNILLNSKRNLYKFWHKKPYIMSVLVADHRKNVFDCAVISTLNSFTDFRLSVQSVTKTLIKGIISETYRMNELSFVGDHRRFFPLTRAQFRRMISYIQSRLSYEYWAIGTVETNPEHLVDTKELLSPKWFDSKPMQDFYADHFPLLQKGKLFANVPQ